MRNQSFIPTEYYYIIAGILLLVGSLLALNTCDRKTPEPKIPPNREKIIELANKYCSCHGGVEVIEFDELFEEHRVKCHDNTIQYIGEHTYIGACRNDSVSSQTN